MSQEIEIEYKNLITIDEYNHLLTTYPFPEEGKKQINHYFETTDNKLKQHGCALRIREKSDTYQITLKEPHSSGLLETHDMIQKDTFNSWIDGNIIPQPSTSKQLKELGVRPESLMYVGSLETIRRETPYQEVLLVLDKSIYNNQTDYELELEAPNESLGMHLFESILRENHVPKRDTPNKIQRFFTSLGHHS